MEYKIVIEATFDGNYRFENMDEANAFSDEFALETYNRLNGKFSVEVISVEEVK